MPSHMISEQLMIGWFVSNQMEVVLGHAQKTSLMLTLFLYELMHSLLAAFRVNIWCVI